MAFDRDSWNDAPAFHVVVDVNSRPPCVAVSGELDLATCAAFRDALQEATEAADDVVAIDFARVTFMGSTGIRELVRALQAVDRIEVRSPSPIVRRALETASVGSRLVLCD